MRALASSVAALTLGVGFVFGGTSAALAQAQGQQAAQGQVQATAEALDPALQEVVDLLTAAGDDVGDLSAIIESAVSNNVADVEEIVAAAVRAGVDPSTIVGVAANLYPQSAGTIAGAAASNIAPIEGLEATDPEVIEIALAAMVAVEAAGLSSEQTVALAQSITAETTPFLTGPLRVGIPLSLAAVSDDVEQEDLEGSVATAAILEPSPPGDTFPQFDLVESSSTDGGGGGSVSPAQP